MIDLLVSPAASARGVRDHRWQRATVGQGSLLTTTDW